VCLISRRYFQIFESVSGVFAVATAGAGRLEKGTRLLLQAIEGRPCK